MIALYIKKLTVAPHSNITEKTEHLIQVGVFAWIRSDIPHRRLPDLEFDLYEDQIESMVFELKIKKDAYFHLQKS